MGTFVVEAQRKPHRLRMLAFILLALIICFWSRYYFASREAKDDPTSQVYLMAAIHSAQPILDTLENYRADHGLYPPTMDRIDPTSHLHRSHYGQDYLYSARRSDWVFISDTCPAREKGLQGWIMKPTSVHEKEVAQFKSDCIAGYHQFQLQSPDFPESNGNESLERWAYYDSFTKQWSVGWCSHDQSSRGHGSISMSATNGSCR